MIARVMGNLGGRALLAALAAGLLFGVTASAIPPVNPPPLPGPGSPFIPPVGAQPAAPVGGCSWSPLGTTEIRDIYTLPSSGGPLASKPASAFAVDPSNPCHIYRSQRGEMRRSDDSGRTFSQNFVDNTGSSSFSRGPITLSSPRAVGPGQLYFYDMSGNNGVFYSAGYGNQDWQQRNGGLYAGGAAAPGGQGGAIVSFAPAPSNPDVIYLVGYDSGNTTLYYTGDGGRQWGLLAPPATELTTVTVDPTDAQHVFAAGGGPTSTSGNVSGNPAQTTGSYYESTNGGSSWVQHSGPGGEASPIELVATKNAVYAHTASAPGGGAPNPASLADPNRLSGHKYWRSVDHGVTWRQVTVPYGFGGKTELVYDAGDNNQMILAAPAKDQTGAAVLAVLGSYDGFQTTRYSRFLPAGGGLVDLQLGSDRMGDFFAQETYSTAAGATDQLFAFKISALAPPPPTAVAGKVPLIGAIKRCDFPALPPVTDQSGPLGTTRTHPVDYVAGSVAFDGQYLDYTQDEDARGQIFRIDPVDCSAGPTITLNPADTGGHVASLFALTYDAKYIFADGHQGAILARGDAATNHDPRTQFGYAAVYAVDPQTSRAVLISSVFCTGAAERCSVEPQAFAYDPYRDQLWSSIELPDQTSGVGIQAILGLGGFAPHLGSTCMTGFSPSSTDYDNPLQSTWEPGAQDIMYVQLEDDTTVLRVNSATCRVLDGFAHEKYSEGNDETDQMACDPITFGQGSPLFHGSGTSVLWLRDVGINRVSAYPIVKGFCPFPSSLNVESPGVVKTGDALTVCANLTAVKSGKTAPVQGQTVTFTLSDRTLGSAQTDSNGRACLAFTVPTTKGLFQLGVIFAGSEAYLPARGAGALNVTDVPPPPPPAARLGTHGVPPPPLNPPAPVVLPAPPALAPGTQIQTQVQAQTQVQPQAGVMTQKQKQTRLQMSRIDGGRTEVNLEASRATFNGALGVQLAALILFGIGLAVRDHRLRTRVGAKVARIPWNRR
ncbi:MAG: WD40/YVTN/BNR-like repeat-containing protein [Candidatus Dormibacteria bacterium]